MAFLYISEYAHMAAAPNAGVQTWQEPPLAEQVISISGVSVQSAAFQATTRVVRLHCDAICSVAFEVDPTATTGNKRLAANQTEAFGVPQGRSFKVAVISNS